MNGVTLQNIGQFVLVLAALLVADAVVRAILGTAHIGGFDMAFGIAATVLWMNRRAMRSARP